MKISFTTFSLMAGIAVALTGCQTPTDIWIEEVAQEQKEYLLPYITEEYLKSDLEENAPLPPSRISTENFKKLNLGIWINENFNYTPSAHDGIDENMLKEIRTDLRNRLQNVFTQSSRFKVYAIYNNGGQKVYNELSDTGAVELPESQLPKIDQLYNLSFSLRNRIQRPDAADITDECAKITVTCDMQRINLQTSYAEKGHTVRAIGYLRFRRYNPHHLSDIKSVIQNTFDAAANNVYLELCRRYPTGGQILSITRQGHLSLDRGYNAGICEKMQFAIYACIKNQQTPPFLLGYGSAGVPEADTTTLRIWQWFDDPDYDEQAAAIVRGIRRQRNWFQKNKDVIAIYATSLGIPSGSISTR